MTEHIDPSSTDDYPVSSGGFGDVYCAKLRDGTPVAIKTIRLLIDSTSDGKKTLKRSARELYTWAKCDHPNVVKLLGLAVFRNQMGMLSLWMEHGCLPEYLRRHPQVDRCQISTQICQGLAYIHDRGIVHGDLKGLNVLVSSDGTPALTDFGNSILGDSTLQFTATAQGSAHSLRWAAPELLNTTGTHSMEADVYALGMTILETITGKVPYFGILDHAIYFLLLINKQAPPRPNDLIPSESKDGDALWNLLTSCWVHEPKDRPRAADVADAMNNIKSDGLLRTKSQG